MDKISVIIPAYNAEKTIRRCIDSVLLGCCGGGYEREIIVVNNGSTDNTEVIVRDMATHNPELLLITQTNKGPAWSRETGLRHATGDYVAWVDSDDWVKPEWLLHLWENIKKYNADISVCRAKIEGRDITYNPSEKIVWNRDEAIREFLIHEKLNGCLWNKLIRRELFEDISFSLEMWYWEDLHVVWKVLKKCQKVVRCNEGTYNFYVHPESMCAQKINDNRVYCALKVWDDIVSDCKNIFPNHLAAAMKKQEEWALADLRNMMKCNLFHSDYENRISSIVRKAGIRGVISQNGLGNRLFALCVLLNMKVARIFTKIYYYISRIRRRS